MHFLNLFKDVLGEYLRKVSRKWFQISRIEKLVERYPCTKGVLRVLLKGRDVILQGWR